MIDEEIPYKVSYRKVKYARVEFSMGNLHLVVPKGYDYIELIRKKQKWIRKKEKFVREILDLFKDRELNEITDEELKQIVLKSADKNSYKLGVNIRKISFRKLRAKWAGINSYNEITINKNMKYLPENLIDYIVFHEAAHMLQRNHSRKFWKLIESEFPGYEKYEKELYYYWLMISHKLNL